MEIKEIKVKSILTKSKLPETDYVVNPYIGCSHKCSYCYADFMKRFTGHKEEWGNFIDVKINIPEILKKEIDKAIKGKVLLSSVTDPYMPIENKYQLTRKSLEILINKNFPISILTKSSLVLRDIDLLKKANCEVGITINTLDENIKKIFEPYSSTVKSRVEAIKKLHYEGIKTYVFIGPIFPYLTNVEEIVKELKPYTNFFMFEDLNITLTNKERILKIIEDNYPNLKNKYEELIKNKNNYWVEMKKNIKRLGEKENLDFRIYFTHKEHKKK